MQELDVERIDVDSMTDVDEVILLGGESCDL